MTARLAEPLPECVLCERPTRRDVWTGSGGLCTACGDALRRAEALRPLYEAEEAGR